MQKTLILSLLAMACATPQAFAFSYKQQPKQQSAFVHVVKNAKPAVSEEAAKKLISTFTSESIDFLSNEKLSQAKKEKEFKRVLVRDFNLDAIARFSLGRNWRQASKEERAEYKKLFKNMIINVYSNRFSEYNGQKIEVADTRTHGKRDVFVTSYIKQASAPDVQVDWRVRNNKQGQAQIIDVIVEGVSMALTQRSEFSSIIQRGGGTVDALITHLAQVQ